MAASALSIADGEIAARQLRRFVNESIFHASVKLGGTRFSRRDFLCECGDLECSETVSMLLGDFAQSSSVGAFTAHA